MHRTLTCLGPDRGRLGLLGLVVLAGLLLWTPLLRADAMASPASQPSGARVRIEPAERVVDPGETFTVDVLVEDVSELGGYELKVAYDPAVVEVSGAENGEFLGSTGRRVIPVGSNVDNQAGIVSVAAVSLGGAAGAEGAGALAVIELTAVGEGITDLDLYDVKLADPTAGQIEATTEGGRVKVGEGEMPTREPTEVPAESPTPSAAPTEAPTESPAPTEAPAETEEPSPAITATTEVAEVTPEGGTPTSGAAAPTGEVDAETPTAAATATGTATADAVPTPTAAPTSTELSGAAESETEPSDRASTDADEGADRGDAPLVNRRWLIVAAALLAGAGVAAIALGVLVFGPQATSNDA